MKPITHPLAITVMDALAAWTAAPNDGNEGPRIAYDSAEEAWRRAGSPLYADPTPMPAPALGMRVWREIHDSAGVTRSPRPYDVTELGEDETWAGFHLAADEIVLITDYRTHEVLWRRP